MDAMIRSTEGGTVYYQVSSFNRFNSLAQTWRKLTHTTVKMKQTPKDNQSHTKNYLPWIISPWFFPNKDYLSSCTFSGSILQLCKVTSILLLTLRRSCAYDKYGETDRWAGWFQYTSPPKKNLFFFFKNCLLRGISVYEITYLRSTAHCIEHIKENKTCKCHCSVSRSYLVITHLKQTKDFYHHWGHWKTNYMYQSYLTYNINAFWACFRCR